MISSIWTAVSSFHFWRTKNKYPACAS